MKTLEETKEQNARMLFWIRWFWGLPLLLSGAVMFYGLAYEFNSGDLWTSLFLFSLGLLSVFYPNVKKNVWDKFWSTDLGTKIRKPFRPANELSTEELGQNKQHEQYLWAIVGKFFRPIFIIATGLWAYSTIPSIGDTPLASLTLNDIAQFIFGIGLTIVCVIWFFKFPDDEEGYFMWGNFAGVLLFIAILVAGYFYLIVG